MDAGSAMQRSKSESGLGPTVNPWGFQLNYLRTSQTLIHPSLQPQRPASQKVTEKPAAVRRARDGSPRREAEPVEGNGKVAREPIPEHTPDAEEHAPASTDEDQPPPPRSPPLEPWGQVRPHSSHETRMPMANAHAMKAFANRQIPSEQPSRTVAKPAATVSWAAEALATGNAEHATGVMKVGKRDIATPFEWPPPSVRPAGIPTWWAPPAKVVEAALIFERRHQHRSGKAVRLYDSIVQRHDVHRGVDAARRAFSDAVHEVRVNRYADPDIFKLKDEDFVFDPNAPREGRRRYARPGDSDSESSDGSSYYDSDESIDEFGGGGATINGSGGGGGGGGGGNGGTNGDERGSGGASGAVSGTGGAAARSNGAAGDDYASDEGSFGGMEGASAQTSSGHKGSAGEDASEGGRGEAGGPGPAGGGKRRDQRSGAGGDVGGDDDARGNARRARGANELDAMESGANEEASTRSGGQSRKRRGSVDAGKGAGDARGGGNGGDGGDGGDGEGRDAEGGHRLRRRKSKSSKSGKKGSGPPWDINNSIWAPRRVWSDSKDFVDSADVERKRISNDWKRACGMGIDSVIAKKDDSGKEDADNNGIADEVEEVEALLWEVRDVIIVLFMYYTCIGSDLCFLYLNQWSQFVDECQLASNKSKFLKKSDTDRLFIAVDTQAAMRAEKRLLAANPGKSKKHVAMMDDDDLKKKMLSRVEFIVALVHISILRYVETKKIPDVSEALHRLIVDDIKPLLSPKVTANPNIFRQKACYRQDVDAVLKKHESSLRNIFSAVCTTGGRGEKERHMSLDEWKGLLRGIELIDVDVSERDAAMCFAWSRMCVADETTIPGRMRDSHLPFEGFLEALVRTSAMKALPTDEEIQQAECADAAAFFTKLRAEEEDRYQVIINTRGNKWGEPPTQPIARCVAHLLSIIVRRVEKDSGSPGGNANMDITWAEAQQWCKKQSFGMSTRG